MEWYYIVGIIAAFFAIVILFYFLNKKGLLSAPDMKVISNIVSALTSIVDTISKATDIHIVEIMDMAMELVNKAVLAAENAWYNNEISKEQRKEYCMDRLKELLNAYQIELTEAQWAVVDTLIAAACEEMGHGGEQKGEEAAAEAVSRL